MIYQIKVRGNLDQSWTDWLGAVKISSEQEEDGTTITLLTVDAADQPALFGILDHIRDINLILVSVTCLEEKNRDPDGPPQP